MEFNGKWYHGRDEFFKDAIVNDVKLTSVYDDLYAFRVME